MLAPNNDINLHCGGKNEYPFVRLLLRPNWVQFTGTTCIGYVLLREVNKMERYVSTTYRFHDLKSNEWQY